MPIRPRVSLRIHLVLSLALCTGVRGADLPVAPDTIAARAEGCSTCHGNHGEGTRDPSFPRIAGKPAGYLFNQLQNFRDGQRSYPPMNYLLAYMQDDYLHELADYFATQPVEPGQAPADHERSAALLATGERLIHHGDAAAGVPACVLCHGSRLTGMEPGIPGLVGLNGRYLAAQLVSWRVGMRQAKQPDCMREIASRLSETQVRAAAAWLAAEPSPSTTLPATAGSWATPLPCGSEPAATPPSASAVTQELPPIDPRMSRGEYLAHVGDCVACHSKHGGIPFAGGFPMPTPFGTLFSPNITPDKETGIGAWTAADFYRMLHTGRSRDGTLLYPAMPFPAYTQITREDSDSIFEYLQTLKPVSQRNRENELRFPYNNRSLLFGWRMLFFREGTYAPAVERSAQFNRGAYLVQGLGHCTSCHSPINALGGSNDDNAFAGGLIPLQNWYAPSLTSNRESGLGNWSVADISALLTGGAGARGAVYGPMAEVTHNSLQYLNIDDATAMSVYLKSLLELNAKDAGPASATPPGADLLDLGRRTYANRCASCHRSDGRGIPPAYPPLAGNPSIEMEVSVNPLRMVLNGGFPPQTVQDPRPYGMPPFAQVLSDEEVAAVVTYIRVTWGNHGTPVTPREANAMRMAPLLD